MCDCPVLKCANLIFELCSTANPENKSTKNNHTVMLKDDRLSYYRDKLLISSKKRNTNVQ